MKSRLLLLVMLLLVTGLVFTSCTQSPEQNPVIQEKFQKIAELTDEVDQLKGKTKDIQSDIDTITQDLTTLKQMPKPAEMTAVDIEEMKAQVKQLNGEVSALKDELSKLKKASGARVTEPKSSDSSSVQPTPAPKKRGQYYTVKEGDTLKSIAQQFSTKAESIRTENHIPEGKEPLPGTRLYIVLDK